MITLAILLVQAVLVIASTRLLGIITSGAVGVELAIVDVLIVALIVAILMTGTGHPENLGSRGVTADDPGYFALGGGLMAGMLMGLTTLVGFDSAANPAEETKDPFRAVPRAIVGSVVAASAVGLAFLVVLTTAIEDVPGVSGDPSPVAAIIREQLGPVMERILLAGIAFAFFGAGMVVMAACSRQIFAMARDGRFPAHRLMSRVNPRTQTPIAATVLILVIGAGLMIGLPGDALVQLIVGGTILPALVHGGVVVLSLVVRRRLEATTGGFSLLPPTGVRQRARRRPGCSHRTRGDPAMIDCLAATGIDPTAALLPLGIAAALLVGGAVTVVALRRNARLRGGAALLLALVLTVAGLSLVGPAAPATAADVCTTASPTPTPTTGPAVILPDQDVTFDSGGVSFAASYRGPAVPASDAAQGVPAVVIIGGTGAVDRNGDGAGIPMQEYAWLADLLSAQGIASIRYDKLGTGATGLGPYTADPDAMLPLSYDRLRVQPARDALSYLAAQPGVDPNRLLLLGHSEGGAVAMIIEHDPGSAPAPAGLLLVEPAYTHIFDVLSRQFIEQMQGATAAGAMTAEDAATLTAWLTAGIAEIRDTEPPFPDPGPVPLPDATEYTALMQSTIQSNIYGSDPTQMVITHADRTRYGKGYDAVDPADYAPEVAVPVFITCGTKDFNTPCGDGTPGSGVIALANAFAPGVAHFVQLPDTVHILRDVGDADVPSLADQITYPFSAVLETEFSAFVAGFTR